MESTVYLMDLRATYRKNLIHKLHRLMESAGISRTVKKRDLVAVKLHFGELGNTAFIRPVFLRHIVKNIKAVGGTPFLTDTNTLYSGTRSDATRHIETAVQNGFAFSVVGAPIVIADGLRGGSETLVTINQKRFAQVSIGSEIMNADAMVSVAHFKGHDLTGFAGTLKNLGMGCASRKGKLAQHSGISPKVKKKRCVGCGDCVAHCSQSAISLQNDKADINAEQCIGCGECIIVCPEGAVQIRWNTSVPAFMENMIEHALGVLKEKSGKSLHMNFITDVSPACDCPPFNDAPIVRDIGILAATDPVAIEQASVDLVNQEPGISGSCLKKGIGPGQDKFKGLYPKIDWGFQLDYAESLGLGTRKYNLERID